MKPGGRATGYTISLLRRRRDFSAISVQFQSHFSIYKTNSYRGRHGCQHEVNDGVAVGVGHMIAPAQTRHNCHIVVGTGTVYTFYCELCVFAAIPIGGEEKMRRIPAQKMKLKAGGRTISPSDYEIRRATARARFHSLRLLLYF